MYCLGWKCSFGSTHKTVIRVDEIPMMRDVLSQTIQIDARAYAVLWAMCRLCYRLRSNGLLADIDIEQMFDPVQAQQPLSEEYREKVRENIQGLQDYCLGRTETLPQTLQ